MDGRNPYRLLEGIWLNHHILCGLLAEEKEKWIFKRNRKCYPFSLRERSQRECCQETETEHPPVVIIIIESHANAEFESWKGMTKHAFVSQASPKAPRGICKEEETIALSLSGKGKARKTRKFTENQAKLASSRNAAPARNE